MRSPRAWWALILMIAIWTIPGLFASLSILRLVLNGTFTDQKTILENLIGSILVFLCGMMPIFIMLPSYITYLDEKSIRQPIPLFKKEINWEDLERLEIDSHQAIIFYSRRTKIRVSSFCFNNPNNFLSEVLNFHSLEKVKEKFSVEEWNNLIELRNDVNNG